jgi:hypothetical protein
MSLTTLKPIVVLLDFDNTIVGDVAWLSWEYSLVRANHRRIRYQHKLIEDDLNHGLIRPYFADFIKLMKSRYHNVEFFVYTASDKRWAEFIISKIEKVLNLRFHRPIFARDSCITINNSYYKSIEKIQKHLCSALKPKYGLLTSYKEFQSIVLIDNNPRSLIERDFQITCPNYNYNQPINVLRHFNRPNIPVMAATLNKILSPKTSFPNTSGDAFFHAYYAYLSLAYMNASIVNNKEKQDRFWKYMLKRMTKRNISEMNSRQLVGYISKHL